MSAIPSSPEFEILRKKHQFEEHRLFLLERVAQLDYEITNAQAEYGALHNEDLPVMKTPDEIICMIFEYACTDLIIMDEDSKEHLRLPEVVISQVCRRWRAIALGLSTLWTHFSHHTSVTSRVPLHRFEAYMDRSRNAGLDLWLGLRSPCVEHFKLLDRALFELSRWKRFTISFEPCPEGSHILNLTNPLLAPNLTYFAYRQSFRGEFFYGLVGHDGVPRVPKPNAILDVQKLQSLMLSINSTVANPLSSSNLKTLRIEVPHNHAMGMNIPWTSLLHVLSYPSLENVSLIGDILDLRTMTADKIHMNVLKQLRLGGVSYYFTFLASLEAPLLEALSLRDISLGLHNRGQSPGNINDIDPYYFPALRSVLLIEIDLVSVFGDPLLKLVRLTASAEDIWICGHNFEESLLDGIMHSNLLHGPAWEKLKDLTLSPGVAGHHEALPFLVDFASRRPVQELAIHVLRETLEEWGDDSDSEDGSQAVYRLYKHASVEVMGVVAHPLWTVNSWPPGDHQAVDCISGSHDPFDVKDFFMDVDN